MRWLVLSLLLTAVALPARAQIPPEWQAAAQVVLGEFEQGTPMAAKPWGHELRQGWSLARAWRQHNNGNIEIILAEYLTRRLLDSADVVVAPPLAYHFYPSFLEYPGSTSLAPGTSLREKS